MDKERSLICRRVETEADVEEAYRIYLSNPEYFLLVSGHIPERREIYRDREVRPPETELRCKSFGLWSLEGENVAVTDHLEGYPEDDVLYLGLLLVDGGRHRQGLGRRICREIEEMARRRGFRRLRLSVMEDNCAGLAFWRAMGYQEIRRTEQRVAGEKLHQILVMEKPLNENTG